MNLAQVYETTLRDRDSGRALTFSVVPARSLEDETVPSAKALGASLSAEGTEISPLEAWSLPFLLDTLDSHGPLWPELEGFAPYRWPLALRPTDRRWVSSFAEEASFGDHIPFEASPLRGQALSSIVTGAGGMVGAYVTRDPMLLLTVPAGIILCRAAYHVGDGIGLAAKALIMRLLGDDGSEDSDSDG